MLIDHTFTVFLYHFVFNWLQILLYTVNHKKGGSTFVIITLEDLDGF